jgi:hypothetical protein
MPGGLLNIVAYGQQNIILNGNPSKTFFKCVYAKYTNFGLQKFRIDFNGQRSLRLTEDSKFTFKIPRYADLLMDTYLVVQLPTIWSPIFPPQDCSGQWAEYGFKWIKNLGTQMIRDVQISIGGQIIAQYSGQYLYNMVERDFQTDKKNLYYKMSGNVPELNDPANSNGNPNIYPNAYYTTSQAGPEPSVRARKIYIPINTWFTLNNKMAFPLVALQYNELIIDITLRPVQELFVIRNIGGENESYPYPYVQPNFNNLYQGFYRFLQPPPDVSLNIDSYTDRRTNWNADIHLISTYAFLTEEEEKVFALNQQKYLIKDVHEYQFNNVTGSNVVQLDSLGMISNWMWYFQRDDAYLRNQWSNYTNWPYCYIPYPITCPDDNIPKYTNPCPSGSPPLIGPNQNPDGTPTCFYITQEYRPQNDKNILRQFGILMDGKYRENMFDSGIYNYVEKYVRTSSNSPDGLYCYNFGLKTDPFDFQPNGAINMSKFKTIELEFTTISPVLDPSAAFYRICDPVTGTIIGVNKPSWIIYDYNFNLHVMEERYNILTFMSGNAALDYAR